MPVERGMSDPGWPHCCWETRTKGKKQNMLVLLKASVKGRKGEVGREKREGRGGERQKAASSEGGWNWEW